MDPEDETTKAPSRGTQKSSEKPRVKKKDFKKQNNLQIEVIDHPEAYMEAEHVQEGTGSSYEPAEGEQYQLSSQQEPNHRQGTDHENFGQQPGEPREGYTDEYEVEPEGDHEYQDSMEDPRPKRSMQSFGQNSAGHHPSFEGDGDKSRIKSNAKNASNGGIDESHMQDFMNKLNKSDKLNKTTKIGTSHEEEGKHELESEEQPRSEIDDEQIDDELVRKQQQEAEELLEETK